MGAVALGLVGASAACAAAAALALTGAPARPGRPSGDGPLDRAVRLVSELPVARRARAAELEQRRRAACLRELPALLDVLTLGLSAGLSFDASLELYCGASETELAGAFSEAMLSWRIGATTREGALRDLAEALDAAALRRFASVVGEALAFGAPLSETLAQQARAIREEQRAQVEEEIERVPVKMLVPLGTLIVPAMFLAILGPLLGSAVAIG